MNATKTIFLVALGTIALSTLLPFFFPPEKAPAPTVQAIGTAPGFTLTSSESSSFKSESLSGKIWVANFFFTSCEGVCPIMSAYLKSLSDSFKENEDVQMVSFSVDPETDTPEKLREYALSYNADTTRWHFLTGELEKINAVMEGMKIGTVATPNDHNSQMVLVDRDRSIRGVYLGTHQSEINRLKEDIQNLLHKKNVSS